MPDYKAIKQQICDLATSHGVTMTATPIPSRDDWEGDKESAHFVCVFTSTGARKAFTVTYSVGSGHAADWLADFRKQKGIIGIGGYVAGDDKKALSHNHPRTIYMDELRAKLLGEWRKHFRPDIADVLSSLALDASGTDQPFSDWCADYGYSDDSRKAEAMYRTCQETMFWLKPAFREDMEKLQNLCSEL